MQTRLRGLQRIAMVYAAVSHAHALAVEQAAGAVREAELLIERQKAQACRSSVEGKVALDAGEHVEWKMHESQKQFTEWNADGLVELRRRRESLMIEAAEVYRAGRLQLEQMDSVLRELRARLAAEQTHREQRESDDRFLSRRWWDGREASRMKEG